MLESLPLLVCRNKTHAYPLEIDPLDPLVVLCYVELSNSPDERLYIYAEEKLCVCMLIKCRDYVNNTVVIETARAARGKNTRETMPTTTTMTARK